MKRARLDFGENYEPGSNECPKYRYQGQNATSDHPAGSAQAQGCVLNARRLWPAYWSGRGAIIPVIHARCAFIDHPIRRGDGDGKQDRRNAWQRERKKALTSPQFENGDGVIPRQQVACRRGCRSKLHIQQCSDPSHIAATRCELPWHTVRCPDLIPLCLLGSQIAGEFPLENQSEMRDPSDVYTGAKRARP